MSCPTFQHNNIWGIIEYALRAFLSAHRVGGVIANRNSASMRAPPASPDAAFWRAEVFSRIDKSESIMHVVPDLDAEMVSPNDTAEQLGKNLDSPPKVVAGFSLPVSELFE